MTTPEPRKASPFAFGTRIFSSLKSPSYRLYFSGVVAHFAAMSMQIVSFPLLIFYLTKKTEMLGAMSLVSASPMILISVFGGAFADRLQKKKLLIGGLLGQAVIAFIIGLTLATGALSGNPDSWWILFVASAVQGIIMGMMMPALQAIIPEIVNRDQLMNAIALNTTGMNVMALVAPPIAGFIIGESNFNIVYFTMAGLYILAASIITFIPARAKIIPSSSNLLLEMQKGFNYMRKDPLIVQILVFTSIIVVLSMPYQQFIPVYVYDILNVGAEGSGILNGVSGAGALIGSILLAALPGKRRGIMLLGSGILAGVALIIFSFSSVWVLSLIFIFFIGLSQTFRQTIASAVLQTYTEDMYMGRVMSILNMQWGIMSLCTFLVGMLAGVLPIQWVLGSLAMLLTFLSLLFFVVYPAVRKTE